MTLDYEIEITYRIPKSDPRFVAVRSHEFIHVGHAFDGVWTITSALSYLNGECLCEPCFTAIYNWVIGTYHFAVARYNLSGAELDAFGNGDLAARLIIQQYYQQYFSFGRQMARLHMKMKEACQQ